MTDAAPTWTDDRIALLAKRWRDGSTASAIAQELGGVSRSGVIAKLHRLGLAGRRKPEPPTPPLKPPAKPASLTRRKSASAEPPIVKQPTLPATRAEDVDIPPADRRQLLDLKHGDCRFPIGDPRSPDFGFCNSKAAPGKAYGGRHCHTAYVPAASRVAAPAAEESV